MNFRRKHTRRLTAALVLCALALQSLIPVGYMPGSLASGSPLMLCPQGLPAGFVAVLFGDGGHDQHSSGHHGGHDHSAGHDGHPAGHGPSDAPADGAELPPHEAERGAHCLIGSILDAPDSTPPALPPAVAARQPSAPGVRSHPPAAIRRSPAHRPRAPPTNA